MPVDYERLRAALRYENSNEWFLALKRVDEFRDDRIVTILREGFKSPDRNIRTVTSRYAEKTEDPTLAADIIESVTKFDDKAAVSALRALGYLGNCNDLVAEFLVEKLAHRSGNVRTNAAKSLGRLKIDTAVPELSESAREPRAGVRLAAIHALAQFGSPDAVSALSHIAADGYRWLSTLAAFDELLAVADTPSRREGLQYVAENGGRRMRRRAVGALLKTPRTVDR